MLSAPAIYKWLFSGILSPLGDSVLDKRILLKFIRFATEFLDLKALWQGFISGSKHG